MKARRIFVPAKRVPNIVKRNGHVDAVRTIFFVGWLIECAAAYRAYLFHHKGKNLL